MAKSIDVPVGLREFNRLFCELEYIKWASSVFDDLLDYLVQCFLIEKEPTVRERLQDTYKARYDVLPQLFRELVLCMDKMIVDDTDWYDPLGEYYEVITSRSKSSAMGQFFTPKCVCDLMTQLNHPEPKKGAGLTINDPACGSGRTLLSFHALNPGNYLFGEDLDPMCVRMTAVNFCLHGVVGQVCHIDTLGMNWHSGGYETWVHKGVPVMRRITKEESHTWTMWQRRLAEANKPEPTPEPTPTAPEIINPPFTPMQPGTQLSLF